MRVNLKGINQVTKVLATGRRVTYFYAWKGGPKLEGRPGEPAFVASYNAAVAQKVGGPRRRQDLSGLCDAFRDSAEFKALAPRTQKDYGALIGLIERDFGNAPVAEFGDREARVAFLRWRDSLAGKSKRQADYAWTVLARVIAWSIDRGLAKHNPCTKGRRLYTASRAEFVWSREQEAAFMRVASPPLALAFQLAVWTGQRQGDLLRLTWFSYDGASLKLKQGKTKVRVVIPTGAYLGRLLDEAKAAGKRDGKILLTSAGTDWTEDGFRASWGKACIKAGVKGVTFNDLRGTAVLRLCLADCTEAEIATITGHKLHEVRSILDAHYFCRHVDLAKSAIAKREAYERRKLGAPLGDEITIALNPGTLGFDAEKSRAKVSF